VKKKEFLGIRVDGGVIERLKAIADKKSVAAFGHPGEVDLTGLCRAAIMEFLRCEEIPE
jgi:hypothetical protein